MNLMYSTSLVGFSEIFVIRINLNISSSLNSLVNLLITEQNKALDILPEKFLSSFSKDDFNV